jgi:hypothetical protein
MIHILNVPNFDFILVHPGVSTDDSSGCILTGSRYELFHDRYFVYGSTLAYLALRKILIPEMIKRKVNILITENFND